MKEKKLTLATKEGSQRLFALFLVLLLLFSFAARLISSDLGNVKISKIRLDARGAAIDTELYYPAWTKDSDSLPAILISHGGGVTAGNMKGFAEELARRGFVVLNVNSYGVGGSEQPRSDEGGQGEAEMDYKKSPGGMIDALDFIRTLKFVDQTRVGIAGHSAGSRRSAMAAMMDCGWLTFNDQMLNVLADTFGLNLTREEIALDADTLAEERLNKDQLQFYNTLKAQNRERYDTRIKACCMIGSNANLITPLKTVEVAGHEVQRNCQVNFGIVTGMFDYNYRGYIETNSTLESWYSNGQKIQLEDWYVIDDTAKESVILGNIFENDSAANQQLSEAIENRQTRIVSFNNETHSKNFFSRATTTDVVKYFEQTLKYNCGNITDPATTRLDASNTVFMVREWMNLLAMVAMVLMVIAFASLLLKTNFFAVCVTEPKDLPKISGSRFLVITAATVVIGFLAIYRTNSIYGPGLPWSRFIPYFASWWLTVLFIAMLAAGALVILLGCWLVDRKNGKRFDLSVFNIKMKPTAFLKTVLMGLILLTLAYASLAVIEYAFGQDYRFWMAALTEMKSELWRYVWRIAILMFPTFAVIGVATNYTTRLDMPAWKDTLLSVVINSAGVYLCCIVNYLVLLARDNLFSSFISCYGMLVFVPLTAYITKKMYRLTNSVWLGAALNSLLISWTLNSTIGLNCERFFGQTWVSNFFNI